MYTFNTYIYCVCFHFKAKTSRFAYFFLFSLKDLVEFSISLDSMFELSFALKIPLYSSLYDISDTLRTSIAVRGSLLTLMEAVSDSFLSGLVTCTFFLSLSNLLLDSVKIFSLIFLREILALTTPLDKSKSKSSRNSF